MPKKADRACYSAFMSRLSADEMATVDDKKRTESRIADTKARILRANEEKKQKQLKRKRAAAKKAKQIAAAAGGGM